MEREDEESKESKLLWRKKLEEERERARRRRADGAIMIRPGVVVCTRRQGATG